ncbi:MAG TPA: ankyrin repeat domain-containing protein [Candidatus Rhabdochlamydia sp.]|nr:ankyrin repeat domain-containing protein [Candidatus Rhabdochlamydia sp.]
MMKINDNNISKSSLDIKKTRTKENAARKFTSNKKIKSVLLRNEIFSTLQGKPIRHSSKISRQKRQYNPRNVKQLQLFSAISKHDPKNNIDTTDEVKDLLREVDINYQDDDGDTFLHAATKEGHQDIVELLVDKGADRTIQNKEHKTALDLANELNNPNKQKIIDLLVRPGPSSIGHGQPGVSRNILRIYSIGFKLRIYNMEIFNKKAL